MPKRPPKPVADSHLAPRPAALRSVGHNVPRAEGVDKVTGRARYVDDLRYAGMLHGFTVRSTIARGRIRAIERDPAFDWTGVTVLDHRDIARLAPGGRNLVAMIVEDQPLLAEGRVEHREEAIALVAHEDRHRALEAARHVLVTYDEEPAVLTLDEATEVQKAITIDKGDLEAAFAAADLIVEGEYRTGHQEQLYIENNGVIALPPGPDASDGGDVTVIGSLQCPFYVSKALETLFGLPRDRVRVVQATTGGGFGGKEEYPSIVAGHAALLARATGRPVKMVYDRLEDLVATTKRHPSIARHRTGVRRDGTIVAMDVDFRLDGGAYVTLSPVVLSRGAIHAAGPYRCDAVRIRARSLKTNTPPNGAFRGFGAPQSEFAVECHMDRIAAALSMDPVALRRVNLLRDGDSTATGQHLRGPVAAAEVLDRALAMRASREPIARRGKAAAHARRTLLQRSTAPRRGTGVALYFHGSGFTGGGELKLASRAALELTGDGVRVLVGSTEIGQGTRTMLAQIVAETLAIPYDWIETSDPDTRVVPDSGPTVASRTCMIVGRILQRAAADLTAAIGAWGTPGEFRQRARRFLAAGGGARFEAQYERPGEMIWSDDTYKGDAYGAYAWGCAIADVEVDPVTYQVRCTDLYHVIDIGKAIHPILAQGQIEGGSLQAVGWALYEEVVMKGGRMANGQLTNYIIPTTLDTPRMHTGIVEHPYEHGPFGAKGVGEAPMDGPAAAIVNAIRDALGVRLDRVPATPELILAAVKAARQGTTIASPDQAAAALRRIADLARPTTPPAAGGAQ